ncbi:hypothetical protein ABZX98_32615 [Streptomyces sp. NPDC002992]|uniref:hypothetical protein n=1 Tax=Streptomyces sp. NPDC002992 TaxID=3154273 RepID=UPI0033B0EDEB
MALIYAFQDALGHWHGDIDAPLLQAVPDHGTFTYLTVPGTPEAASPFAGQTLKVLVAATDLDPGPVTYQLDDGGRFQATWYVYTLLATPVGSRTTVPYTPAHDTTPEHYLDITLTDNGRRYVMTATRNDDGNLAISLKVCTLEGEVQGELSGAAGMGDLSGLTLLLGTAITTTDTPSKPAPPGPTDVPAPRRGAQWTGEERTRLLERYRQEQDFIRLGHEFGRSALSIQYQLAQLGLVKRPTATSLSTSTPARPPVRTGPTHEELRKSHARSHTPWTDQEERQLAQRCEQGATAEEMSEEFGRTVGAIESRLRLTGANGPAADKAREQYL